MIRTPTAFVLGAGSMADYGFPIGWELVRDVIEGFAPNVELRQLLLKHSDFKEDELNSFVGALHGSAQNSVDAFLEERKEFLEIGIATMSMVLIRRENKAVLYKQRDPYQNWLRNLLMHLRGTAFEEFSSNMVSFITFNYDRSLEYFLCRSVAETFGKAEEESGKIISKIPIIHLHGQLGYLPWQGQKDIRPYDTTVDRSALLACVSDVKVVNRNTNINSAEFEAAKKLLAEAVRIYFMGVGFNNENLSRLGVMDFPANKAVSATGVGLTSREHGDLNARLGGKVHIAQNSNCIDLLRNHVGWD